MKRTFDETRLLGFCVTTHYILVNPKDFKFFKACDSNVLLCNCDHEATPADFIHQQLPSVFSTVNLNHFAKFANKVPIKPETVIDFRVWVQLLAFLHADSKYDKLIRETAKLATNAQSMLSAFSAFGTVYVHTRFVPMIEENANFFIAHYKNFIITKPINSNVVIHIPDEILKLLNQNLVLSCAYKLLVPQRDATAKFWLEFFSQSSEWEALLKQVCEILVAHNYIITRTPTNRMLAIGPEEYDNIHLVRYRDIERSIDASTPENQVYMSGPNEMKWSAKACKYHATNLAAFKDYMATPRQNPGLSRQENIDELKTFGYVETIDYRLANNDTDSDSE